MNFSLTFCLSTILMCFTIHCRAKDGITVEEKQKEFIGLKKTIEGKEIDYFLGIPYAEPPIGKLGFKKPQPFKYEKPINATKWPNLCYQTLDPMDTRYIYKNMSEDCLYLNIWSPKKSNVLKPVMVWIHGGALLFGTNGNFGTGLKIDECEKLWKFYIDKQ
jgi:carboxylesterase type B